MQERNTVQVLAGLVLGLLLSACSSGGDRNPSEVTQIGSALNGACTPSTPCSVWDNTATPAEAVNTSAVELGVKVQSTQAGTITGIRFYKDDANATHTVNLWNQSGTLLATATSTSETSSGWQSVSFATPIAVSANTTYVASYFMPGGSFALTRSGLSSAVVNPPLEALADGQDGGDGVYTYGSGSSFPSSTFASANYWVDVLFTAPVACTSSSPCSIWPSTATPAEAVNTSAVELGVKVQSSQTGFISGVRFYKDDTNSTHTVNLWDPSGTLLATATSTSETSSGWQSASFATPVAVSANTTYVASYFMPGGNFALTRGGLSSAVVNGSLEALADGQDGGNAVYSYGSVSSFPSSTFAASNYWVDILFYPSAISGDAGAGDGAASDAEAGDAAASDGAAGDSSAGEGGAGCTSSSPCSIWPSTATPAEAVNTSAVELGVKVQSSQTGFISGVRFYKDDTNSTHTVNLWDRSGTLLATATSTSETSSGWQSVSFATAVAVSANTTYVASYFMPGGNFALTRGGLSSAVVNGSLEALADGQDGGNAVYSYGSVSSFPSSTFAASNYWVDILFYSSGSGDSGAGDGAAGDSASDSAAGDSTVGDGSAGCTPSSPCSIWPSTATPAEAVNTSPVELGVKVQSSQTGFITGVRFYKEDTASTHTVHLWSGLGNVLATATSTSETSSGWQTVTFAQPVGVGANTTYVASYFMPGGNFALTRSGLSGAVVNAPLEALADGQDGGNGVYGYGSSSSFPTNTFGSSNYWVDILFYSDTSGAGDGGTDASSDGNGPSTIQQYATAYGQAYCTGLGKCCPGYPAAFDLASCSAAWSTLGWESTLPANAAVYTAGHLTYNPTQAGACLSALQNFACTTGGTVTAAQYAAVTNPCLNVLTGTIPVGSGGCLSSFECINGYCAVPGDGGTGTCTALLGNGGTCAPGVDSQDEMCSQVGTFQPALWCNRLAGGATGTCAAPLADPTACYNAGAGFYSDYGCSSLMCGDIGCGGTATYPTPGFCANWPGGG